MATKTTTKENQSSREKNQIASLREPSYPTQRMTQSVKKTAVVNPVTNEQYHTRKMKTKMSQWTPVLHKPSNEQIFVERRDLVAHWFDLWTDSQRKRFFNYLLHRSKKSQLSFIQHWFQERVPVRHLDFTTVLPKFLSLYILSYLDPRSLCRASVVSWHWKFLTEQDDLWRPKCVKFGWYLPYSPSNNEFGAWKRHYIHCLLTLDVVQNADKSVLYGKLGDGTEQELAASKQKHRRTRSTVLQTSSMSNRPPWLDPDPKPFDLQQSYNAMVTSVNPNDPSMPTHAYLHTGRWGVSSSKGHSRSWTEPSRKFEYGLEGGDRKDKHRALTNGDEHDVKQQSLRGTLSESMMQESLRPDIAGVYEQSWSSPVKRPASRRKDLSGGGDYSSKMSSSGVTMETNLQNQSYPSHPNPRVILISSSVPAREVLVSAVLFGVIPVVYNYDGMTLEALLQQVEETLKGRHAKSIGLFVDGAPGQLRLVHHMTSSLTTVEHPEVRQFWEVLCTWTLPASLGGHIDIFPPLAASEPGLNLLQQLMALTGMTFASPTGVSGPIYSRVLSEWSESFGGVSPPTLYFNTTRLAEWISMAEHVTEATIVSRQLVKNYFNQESSDMIDRVTGDLVYSAMGLDELQSIRNVAPIINEGLKEMANQKADNQLEFLIRFLQESLPESSKIAKVSKSRPDTLRSNSPVAKPETKVLSETMLENDSDIEEEIASDIEELLSIGNTLTTEKVQLTVSQPGLTDAHLQLQPSTASSTKSFVKINGTQNGETEYQPEMRTQIAQEILHTEQTYRNLLKIVKDVYVRPLQAALQTNHAIINQPNLQMIFSDIINILKVTSDFLSDLKSRLDEWGPHQCLGDSFVKMQSKLKTYTNFHNNYPIVLATIEKCREQHPAFRSFLRRHDKTPETKMLSLQDLLLVPTRRIQEYVRLLSALELHTSPDHADRSDIAQAIETFQKLQKFVDECKRRCEREHRLIFLQKRILKCPNLLESNRFLIREDIVAHLKPPPNDLRPDLRIYQHIENLGVFLFNDALVVTITTNKPYPYERCVEVKYSFLASLALTKLKVLDLPDTKFNQNVFSMTTPKRKWICSASNYSNKLAIISSLEGAITAAMEVD
ncbi:epithelial cell-transforming sequence 2 oncogene-like [Anneissia japonica]|uniref:epithelial cell-transforming sequence 2 oncogene-like n=1 Tax=Anneissia japonica TaxID=1529436 RepID=UPI0014255C2A|nr:epithelial cell-transforming sequence 2 oncogene-like [Anneissia japonica]